MITLQSTDQHFIETTYFIFFHPPPHLPLFLGFFVLPCSVAHSTNASPKKSPRKLIISLRFSIKPISRILSPVRYNAFVQLTCALFKNFSIFHHRKSTYHRHLNGHFSLQSGHNVQRNALCLEQPNYSHGMKTLHEKVE